jgi:hypothetical protein
MSPSPVTIAYEYERPRFEYTVTVDGDEHTTEANYCVQRDGQYVFEAVSDIVARGATMYLERTETFACPADSVASLDPERISTDVWELQVVQPPSLLERLFPWRWPPDVEESPFTDVPAGDELVHPDREACASYTGDVLHSLGPPPENERA